MSCEPYRRAPAGGQASELSLDDVLQHLLVERQVRHDPLQPAVLLLELPQPLHLRRHQTAVLRLPIVVRRLADPRLAADLLHRRAFLALPRYCPDSFALSISAERRPARAHAVAVFVWRPFNRSIDKYLLVDHSVPATCRKRAAARFNADCPSGNDPTTRVRRRISRRMRSSGLFVLILRQCSSGKA